jgi:hypothetical protein
VSEPGGADPTPDRDASVPPSVRRLAAFAGSTTVLTAILFYFGWSRAYYFYDYLGVDSSLLNLTTRDYLQLSVDGLFVPVLVAGCVALLLLWARPRLVGLKVSARRRRTASLAVLGAGVLLLANGVSRVVVETPLNRPLLVAPLSLAAGAWLLFAGMRMRPRPVESAARSSPAGAGEWLAVVTLTGVALFWMANDYSAEVGTSRAQQFVADLPSLPNAQLYSGHRLGLTGRGVQETRCQAADTTYRYRYDGLKLVLQSGDVYLLVPTQWSRLDGVAFLLPRGEHVRLQFSPAGVLPDPAQPC